MPPEIIRDIIIALIAGAPALIKVIVDGRNRKAEIAALKKQNLRQAEINAALSSENSKLHDQIGTLAISLGERDTAVSELKKSTDALTIEYRSLKDKYDVLKAQYETLQANYNVLKLENEQLRAQLVAVQKKTGPLSPVDGGKAT